MKHITTLFLLISTLAIAQNQILKVKLNAITYEDAKVNKRKYTIKYQIENTTKNEVSFFLIPTTLIAHAASSMTLYPVYKLYRNGVLETMDGPFSETVYPELEDFADFEDKKSPEAKAFIEKINKKYSDEFKFIIQNYKQNGGTSTDSQFIFENNQLLQSKITLKPNEIKNFEIKTIWDKNRYFKDGVNEFYLDENDKFEFELDLILNKSNRNENLSEAEFSKFSKDIYFLEGTYVSNKMEIVF